MCQSLLALNHEGTVSVCADDDSDAGGELLYLKDRREWAEKIVRGNVREVQYG
jgi:hypothetical protein